MRGEKYNYKEYLATQKAEADLRAANIGDLLKRNKQEEKRDKIVKFSTLLVSFFCLAFLFGIFIYL